MIWKKKEKKTKGIIKKKQSFMSSSRLYEIVLHELPAHLTDLVYRFCWIIAFSIGLFVVWILSVSLFEARSKSWKIAENKFGRQFKHPLLFIFFHLVLLLPDQKYFVDWSGGNRSLWGSATRWPGAWGALSTSPPTRCQNTEDNIPSITSIPRILKTLFQVWQLSVELEQ